jgi:hypothetical protein
MIKDSFTLWTTGLLGTRVTTREFSTYTLREIACPRLGSFFIIQPR